MHPILLNLGFIQIPAYGAMVALGFGVTIYYCYKNIEKSRLGISQDQLLSIATWLIVISMFGARFFYVLQYWMEFQGDWAAIFLLKQREGFVFYGGLIFGLLYLFWYCRHYKVDFWKFLDYIIPAGMLGYGIGRIGCFLNGCCYGAVTAVPWAVVFPHHPGEWRHPTQLYEMTFGVVCFFVLKYWNEKRKMFSGQTLLLGIMAYSVERFLVEMIRINPLYGPFSEAQWISVVLFVVFGVLYYFRWKRQDKAGTSI
jgi:phosphatidylglycerol:prolipoprotein diacylglycerol transferase